MDARGLSDVGFVRNAHKAAVGSEAGVWVGEWVAPLDGPKFLASAPAQYEAFSRSMRKLAPAVAPHVGKVVDGRRASLSGLLGAGHLAGENGIASWVASPEARRRFAATTTSFERTNGIF